MISGIQSDFCSEHKMALKWNSVDSTYTFHC
jgi:hypothetical protein